MYFQNFRQTVYQRGGQREGSPHYVFLYSDDEDCGPEDIPLQPRRCAKAPPRQVEVIKVLLKTEDTLQALALRYQCTVSYAIQKNLLQGDAKSASIDLYSVGNEK